MMYPNTTSNFEEKSSLENKIIDLQFQVLELEFERDLLKSYLDNFQKTVFTTMRLKVKN